jgi:hypothetical protein
VHKEKRKKKEERRKEIIAMAAMQIMQLRKGNE